MFTRAFRWGPLVLVLAASVCMGQERPDGNGDKPTKDRAKRRARGPGRRGPDVRPERFIKELKLDEDQQASVREIFKEHGEKRRRLRASLRPPPEVAEKLRELREAMQAAREADDEDQVKQVIEQMRAVHKEWQQGREPAREQLEAAREELHKNLLAVMHDDQKKRFEELWEEWAARRRFRGPRRSPSALKAVVEKLPDLAPEQKQRIDQLFEQFKEATRTKPKKSPEERKLVNKLYGDVIDVLTPEQGEKVEKKLRGRRRGPRGDDKRFGGRRGEGRRGRPRGDQAGDDD